MRVEIIFTFVWKFLTISYIFFSCHILCFSTLSFGNDITLQTYAYNHPSCAVAEARGREWGHMTLKCLYISYF